MCQLMDNLEYLLSWLSVCLGILIAGLNFIFRTILIEFAEYLKPSTFTEEMKWLKLVIFTVQFFNGCILIIIMSAYNERYIISFFLRG